MKYPKLKFQQIYLLVNCHPELVEGRPKSIKSWIRQVQWSPSHHDNFFNLTKSLMNFSITLIIVFFFLIHCEEKKPEFYPEFTNASLPVDGILPYFKGNVMDPYWVEKENFPEDLKRLPNFSLLSHANEEVNRDKLLGKYTLVIFFYAKCKGICPMITSNMVKFLPQIENNPDIQIISFSVNPEEDSVEVLQKFRKQYNIKNENWIFLTGSKKTIYDIARKEFSADVKVIKGQDDLTDFVHTENVYLLDKKQYLRGIYRAKGTGDLERLLVELKTLREEDGKSKSP